MHWLQTVQTIVTKLHPLDLNLKCQVKFTVSSKSDSDDWKSVYNLSVQFI